MYLYNDTITTSIGIRTASPTQALEVNGTVNATDYVCRTGTDCIGATEIDASSLASECSTITGSADLCDDDDTCSTEACTIASDDTLTSPIVGGALDMANYIISNIGNANTDFSSDGSLTLNGNLSTLGTSNTISGNTNFDGGTLFVDKSNDRVGIGTTAPGKKLEVSNSTQGITFDPTVTSPTINTTATTNLTITSSAGNVIIQLG